MVFLSLSIKIYKRKISIRLLLRSTPLLVNHSEITSYRTAISNRQSGLVVPTCIFPLPQTVLKLRQQQLVCSLFNENVEIFVLRSSRQCLYAYNTVSPDYIALRVYPRALQNVPAFCFMPIVSALALFEVQYASNLYNLLIWSETSLI
jgi:hypothetical protein